MLTWKIYLKIKSLVFAIQPRSVRIEFGGLTLGPSLIFRNLAKSDSFLEAFYFAGTYNPSEKQAAFHLDTTYRAQSQPEHLAVKI